MTRYWWDRGGAISGVEHDGRKVLFQRDVMGREVRRYFYESGLDLKREWDVDDRLLAETATVNGVAGVPPRPLVDCRHRYGAHARLLEAHDSLRGPARAQVSPVKSLSAAGKPARGSVTTVGASGRKTRRPQGAITMRRSGVISLGLLMLCAGCADDRAPPPLPGDLLVPPPDGQGVQYAMVTEIAAGTEAEHCQFFRAPPEGLNVNRDETRFTQGSHHVLLYLTPYAEIPTVNELGDAIDTSKPFDCSDGVTLDWKITNLVAGSQNVSGGSMVAFPAGVAMKVPPSAVLLMNVHYVNSAPEPLEPDVRVNVWTIPDEEVQQEGGLLFWYNVFIRVDPNQSGMAKMSCPLTYDITLKNAQSHMHRRGVDYQATRVAPDGSRELVYESASWEGVPVKVWDEGLPVSAGSRIEYACGYQNTESRTVYQGPRSSDEMCMFIASYWPARAEVSNCALDPSNVAETQNFNADWVGTGSKTCAETLGCVQELEGTGFHGEGTDHTFIEGLTDCVLAARPESSRVVSDGIRCLLTHEDPLVECEPEIHACMNE